MTRAEAVAAVRFGRSSPDQAGGRRRAGLAAAAAGGLASLAVALLGEPGFALPGGRAVPSVGVAVAAAGGFGADAVLRPHR